MTNPFEVLKKEKALNESVRDAFINTYGKRGAEAFDTVVQNRVKKYLDYFVVVGKNDEYCVEDDFCSCDASNYGKECYHILAVKIAKVSGVYEKYNLWFYAHGVDEDEVGYE